MWVRAGTLNRKLQCLSPVTETMLNVGQCRGERENIDYPLSHYCLGRGQTSIDESLRGVYLQVSVSMQIGGGTLYWEVISTYWEGAGNEDSGLGFAILINRAKI